MGAIAGFVDAWGDGMILSPGGSSWALRARQRHGVQWSTPRKGLRVKTSKTKGRLHGLSGGSEGVSEGSGNFSSMPFVPCSASLMPFVACSTPRSALWANGLVQLDGAGILHWAHQCVQIAEPAPSLAASAICLRLSTTASLSLRSIVCRPRSVQNKLQHAIQDGTSYLAGSP